MPRITGYELRCYSCQKWSTLTPAEVKQAQEDMDSTALSHPMRGHTCTHCGNDNAAPHVGKYDEPNTPKRMCAVQYVTVAR